MNELKMTRTLKELSQFQVAIITGIHQSRISLIENGYIQPRDDEKKKLAKGLKKPVETLFPGKRKGRGILTQEIGEDDEHTCPKIGA